MVEHVVKGQWQNKPNNNGPKAKSEKGMGNMAHVTHDIHKLRTPKTFFWP